MKLFIGVTDNDWFDFLSRRQGLDEVNFWQPSGKNPLRSLNSGELFLFKLHKPYDKFIAGGGFFVYSSILPVSLAWEAFGEKNGAASYGEMKNLIEKYHKSGISLEDYRIGCIFLCQPFFLKKEDWIPVPQDFSHNIGDLQRMAGLMDALVRSVRRRVTSQQAVDVSSYPKVLFAVHYGGYEPYVEEIIVVVGYMAEKIMDYFGTEFKGVRLQYVHQEKQLGTGHAVACAEELLRDREEFVLLMGDNIYAKIDVQRMLQLGGQGISVVLKSWKTGSWRNRPHVSISLSEWTRVN